MKNFMTLILLFFVSVQVFATSAYHREVTLDKVENWQDFRKKMIEQENVDHTDGWAYMVSGGLLLAGGLVGYHNGQTPVEKLAYSVSQSLGVAGIGYGAYLHYVGGEERAFYDTVEHARGLRSQDKDELVRSYVQTWRINRHNEKVIRIVTHSLVAALNIYNALQEERGDLRTGLMVIGGANALAAISLSF